MANKEDNLIPFSERTLEDKKRIASMGGKRSGEVRREKATMKAALELLLNETNNKGKTYRELATLGLIKGAINGNAQNYKTILETLGELVQTPESTSRVVIVNSLPKDDEDGSNN